MASMVEGLIITIQAGIEGFANSLDTAKAHLNDFQKDLKKNKADLQQIGIGITAFGGAVVGALALSLKASAEHEKVFTNLKVAIENTGRTWDSTSVIVDKFAAKLQHMTKYGAVSSSQVLTTLTQMTGDFGLAMNHTKDVMDLATAKNIDLNTASQIYGKALNGNVETLKRYGINIEAATGQQLKNMTATEKSTAAVDLMRKMFGGAAEQEGKGFIALMISLKNAIGDISEIIGDIINNALAPYIASIRDTAEALRDWMAKNENLVKWLTIIIGSLGGLAAAIGPILLLLPQLVAGTKILIGAFGLLAGPAGIITAIIAGLALLYIAWSTNFLGIKDITAKAVDFILASFDYYSAWIKNFINNIANTVDTLFTYTLRAQIAFKKLMGENTEELDAQLIELQKRIAEREKESAKNQGKTWTDYYNQRQSLRKLLTEAEEIQIEKIKQKDINAANEQAAVRIKTASAVREYKTQDMVTEESQRKSLEDAALEGLKKQEQQEFEWTVQREEWRLKDEEEELKSLDKKAKAQEEAAQHVAGRWEESFNRVSNAMAEHIVDSVSKMKSLKDVFTTIFDDIKTTILGTFRQILVDYIQSFLKQMIKQTTEGLSGSGGITDIFGNLFGSIKKMFSGGGGAGGGGIGGILGSAGIGAGIGTAIGAVTGGGTGATIGGTLGGIAGSFIPIPGGKIIGSAIGGLLGGLFRGKGTNVFTATEEQEAYYIIAQMMGITQCPQQNAKAWIQSQWKTAKIGNMTWHYIYWKVWQGFVDRAYKNNNMNDAISWLEQQLQSLNVHAPETLEAATSPVPQDFNTAQYTNGGSVYRGSVDNLLSGLNRLKNLAGEMQGIENLYGQTEYIGGGRAAEIRGEAGMLINELNVTVNGNVDDPAEFARLISEQIAQKVQMMTLVQV